MEQKGDERSQEYPLTGSGGRGVRPPDMTRAGLDLFPAVPLQ